MARTDLPEFRVASIADAPAILRLLEAAFGQWPTIEIDVSPLEHLEWKMQPPEGIPARHIVGELDGEIVAVDLRWMTQTQVGEQVVLTNDGAEKAVHPRLQGRGISLAMNESLPRLAQPGGIGIATPNIGGQFDRASRAPLATEELRTWVRAFDLRVALGSHRHDGLRHLVPALARHLRRPRAPEGARSYQVSTVARFDERYEALWDAARRQFDVIRLRRPPNLNWRLADPRSGSTLIIEAGRRGELAGYVAFRRDGDDEAAELLDLLTDPAHPSAAVALLRAGSERLRARGVRAVRGWLPVDHPAEGALRAAGFVVTEDRVPVRFSRLPNGDPTVDLSVLQRPGFRWHALAADFEHA